MPIATTKSLAVAGRGGRRSILSLGAAVSTAALVVSRDKPARAAKRRTCGQEMAHAAEVPDRLATLFAHVADNMESHARWTDSSAMGAAESSSLIEVARHYRAIVDAAKKASVAMRSMERLPGAR